MASEVASLLAQSWAAHADRKRGKLSDAYEFRRRAHELDPEHTDPAWQDEQAKTPRGVDTHKAVMAFYEEALKNGR